MFILLGVWQMFGGNFVNGLWIGFIGWFLENAALSEMRGQAILDALVHHQVREVTQYGYVAIPAGSTLQQLVDDHVLAHGRRSFRVETIGHVLGLLTLHLMTTVPRASWETVWADQVMIPAARMRTTRPDADLASVLRQMDRDGVNQLPVIDGGRTIGMMSGADIISFLQRSDVLTG